MEFGIQFFPDVKPEQKSGAQYFDEALILAEESEKLGFTHVRIVEHYFHYYGGYSPNPMLFLTAAAQRTRRSRLVTGAVLPVFNHPLKLAGEIGMLDALSGGRLDVGFARAFLPHENIDHLNRRPLPVLARPNVCHARECAEQIVWLEVIPKDASRDPTGDQRRNGNIEAVRSSDWDKASAVGS